MSPSTVPGRPPLTPRETQALAAAADGKSLVQIAEHLGVTREHVSRLLTSVYRSLGVHTIPSRALRRQEAIRIARASGSLRTPDQP